MEKDLIILAIYVTTYNLTRVHVDQLFAQYQKQYEDMYKDTNKNVKIYWFPVNDQPTRVECVYPPPSISGAGMMENELLKLYKLLLNNTNNDEAKELIRDIERKLKFKKINDRINEN